MDQSNDVMYAVVVGSCVIYFKLCTRRTILVCYIARSCRTNNIHIYRSSTDHQVQMVAHENTENGDLCAPWTT